MSQNSTQLAFINFSKSLADKIKNLIKEKLIEIGAYVDDELPDYVMIMLANKKNEKQMADDLNLFLGANSQHFSSWLHARVHQLKKEDMKQNESKHSQSNKEQKKDQNETQEPELAIQIESNEFNDEDNDTHHQQLKENRNLIEKQNKEFKFREESMSNQQFENEDSQKEIPFKKDFKEGGSLSNKRLKTGSNEIRSSIVSHIGAVVKHNDVDDTLEKYDPHKPMIGNVASVIKVSKRIYSLPKSLQPNKSILLKAIEDANNSVQHVKSNNISRNSFSDNDDDDERLIKINDDQLKINKKSIKSRLNFNKNPNDESNNVSFMKSRLIINKNSNELNKENEILEDKRRIEINLNESNDSNMDNDLNTNEINSNPKFIVTLKGINEKEFLEKMDDYDDANKPIKRKFSDDNSTNDDVQMDISYAEDEIGNDQNNLNMKRKKTRCSFWPSCDKGESCPYVHPNKPCETFPNCSFGNKCLYLHPSCRFDGFCTRSDCPYTHLAKILVPQIQPVSTIPKQSSKKHQFVRNPSLNKYVINHKIDSNKSAQIECKFGNLCKNPNCIYIHSRLPPKSALKWCAPGTNTQDRVSNT